MPIGLWKEPGWAEVFGPVLEALPRGLPPAARQPRVRPPHLFQPARPTYAQKHPDEDFAETFAVWLTPRSAWRRRYRYWPALKKLQYVDDLMRRMAKRAPRRTGGKLLNPVEEMTMPLAEHYGQRAERFRAAAQGFVDDRLRVVFPRMVGNSAVPGPRFASHEPQEFARTAGPLVGAGRERRRRYPVEARGSRRSIAAEASAPPGRRKAAGRGGDGHRTGRRVRLLRPVDGIVESEEWRVESRSWRACFTKLGFFRYSNGMNKLTPRTAVWIGLDTCRDCVLCQRHRGGRAGAKPAARPTKPASAEQIDKLIRQLGDKDYYIRQRAQDELARVGFEAFDALNAATTDADLEIASRAKYLLRLMRVEWTLPSDSAEVKKCLRDYEYQRRGPHGKGRCRRWPACPDGEGVAALCRLVRFEKSPLLSKTAALALLSHRSGAVAAPRSGRNPNRSQSSARLQAARRRMVIGLVAAAASPPPRWPDGPSWSTTRRNYCDERPAKPVPRSSPA